MGARVVGCTGAQGACLTCQGAGTTSGPTFETTRRASLLLRRTTGQTFSTLNIGGLPAIGILRTRCASLLTGGGTTCRSFGQLQRRGRRLRTIGSGISDLLRVGRRRGGRRGRRGGRRRSHWNVEGAKDYNVIPDFQFFLLWTGHDRRGFIIFNRDYTDALPKT